MITLTDVSKSYGPRQPAVVRNLNLHVQAETMLALVGESGSGKTTTLKMINRLTEPTSGQVTVDGINVQEQDPIALRRKIGYAFQGIGLFPHMSVAQNIAIVPALLHWSRADIDARIDQLLELVALPADEYKHRYPQELSGGQQQRVGLARALAAQATILLLDEPFGALDPITRDALQIQLKELQRRLKLTIVLVTHDVTEALLLAERIAVMRNGEIVGQGKPEQLFENPGDPYIEALLDMPKRQAKEVSRIAGA